MPTVVNIGGHSTDWEYLGYDYVRNKDSINASKLKYLSGTDTWNDFSINTSTAVFTLRNTTYKFEGLTLNNDYDYIFVIFTIKVSYDHDMTNVVIKCGDKTGLLAIPSPYYNFDSGNGYYLDNAHYIQTDATWTFSNKLYDHNDSIVALTTACSIIKDCKTNEKVEVRFFSPHSSSGAILGLLRMDVWGLR